MMSFAITSRIDLVERARSIGDRLIAQATVLEDGSITWGRGAGLNLEPVVDSGPFNGRCGEALFFAALHTATSNPVYLAASDAAVCGLVRTLGENGSAARIAMETGLGNTGIGGMIYALTRISLFTKRHDLLLPAQRLAATMTPEWIEEDNLLDVQWGAACSLLALIVMAEAGVAPELERMQICADHLLRSRARDPETGHIAWAAGGSKIVNGGFAHGSSGIAYALLRYFEFVGEPKYRDAALAAFAFERTLYRKEVMNWADTADQPTEKVQMCSWCHGAPGMALSRLAIIDTLTRREEAEVIQDLVTALQKTAASGISGIDNLCCGTFGRIDILLEAGRRLGNDFLEKEARKMAHRCVQKIDQRDITIPTERELHLGPGLWQGLAGVGYTLLRLSNPEAYPCLLGFA